MPFYTRLRPRKRESAKNRTTRLRTIDRLVALRHALRRHLERQGSLDPREKTVRICTWNVREFGGSKHGGRDYEPLYYIAEIISHFDIIALQEVREDLEELEKLHHLLGRDDWEYLATDVTDGSSGNNERMVFLYNKRKANFCNIAGELTLPKGEKVTAAFGERLKLEKGLELLLPDGADLSGDHKARTAKKGSKIKLDRDLEIELPAGCTLNLPEGCWLALPKSTVVTRPQNGVARVKIPTPAISANDACDFRLRLPGGVLDDSFKQFARTPYVVEFQSGWLKLNLATVHIFFGDNDDKRLMEQRRSEIAALTKALGDRAREVREDDPTNRTMVGLLGDFNIISKDHETMKALESNDFIVPDELKKIPGSNVAKDKAYDQIAFWGPNVDRGYAKLDIRAAGVFDFFQTVYRKRDETVYKDAMGSTRSSYSQWRTYKMSDYLPMWIELRNDFSEDYLDNCRG